MPRIHPTAIVHPQARLAESVEIGPFCVVEQDVELGEGCVLREGAVVRRYSSLGRNNFVDAHTVLGGEPQDLKFRPDTVSYLRIGDDNVFRENVTISRATTPGGATVVGSRTYWMVGAHAGHDAIVEDECILINGSALAGHTVLGRRAILSAHVVVHQFCWIGRGAMGRGNAGATQHVPPYCIWRRFNDVAGLNTVGLRRSKDITEEDRRQIKEAFRLTYRSGLTPAKALAEMDAHTEWGQAAAEFREFIRRVLTAKKPNNRGLAPSKSRRARAEEETD